MQFIQIVVSRIEWCSIHGNDVIALRIQVQTLLSKRKQNVPAKRRAISSFSTLNCLFICIKRGFDARRSKRASSRHACKMHRHECTVRVISLHKVLRTTRRAYICTRAPVYT